MPGRGFAQALEWNFGRFFYGEICRDFSNKNGDLLGSFIVILPRSERQEHNVDFRE
jgi:hypothetical protein